MAGTRAAIRYAKAVLSLASDNKSADAVHADMTRIGQTLQTTHLWKQCSKARWLNYLKKQTY